MREGGSTDRDSPLRLLHEWLVSPTQVATGSTRLRVGRVLDGSWYITEPGRDSALRHFTTRERALRAATSTLAEARGGQIEVTEENGAVQLVPVAAGKRPWWQVTRTPLTGLLLGLLWLGLFILRASTAEWPAPWRYETLALVLPGVCAALYLSSTGFLLLRRRRARITVATPLSRGDHSG